MRRQQTVPQGCLVLAILLGSAGQLRADPICQQPQGYPFQDCRFLLLAGATEEPDPMIASGPVATGSTTVPDVQFDADSPQIVTGNGMTVAVWVDSTFGNHDIYFSEWRQDGWHDEPLTVGGGDDVGPSAAIAGDGAVWVAWWEADVPRQVRVVRRDPATHLWSQPVQFTGMYGGRPSVLTPASGEVLVAYERNQWSGGQEVVIRRVQGTGAAVEEVLARTSREAPLFVQLHPYTDRLYIDWIHRVGYYGYSEYRNGHWGVSPTARPLTQRTGTTFVEVQFQPRSH